MGGGPGPEGAGSRVASRTARARAETLRAAPETVSGTGQQHGGAGGEWGVVEWGAVGPYRIGQGAGSGQGAGPYPPGLAAPNHYP